MKRITIILSKCFQTIWGKVKAESRDWRLRSLHSPVPSLFPILLLLLLILQPFPTAAGSTIYQGNPGNYLTLLAQLQPGDTLLLDAGTYTDGLPLYNLNGSVNAPIVIAGPTTGGTAVFLADPCICYNTIEIQDSSYIEIRNLELDGQQLSGVDAVKAGGNPFTNWAHHITLENLTIHDHDNGQQTVAISTKIPVWDWVIRANIIDGAGTGLYLGDSTGDAPFINGLIEHNLVMNTLGYNMQIKQQNPRPTLPGIPTSGKTIIRHNVFSKANNTALGGDARPNLLVGHWPLTGAGSNDLYEIYGNFFYENESLERLFQGEGNVALYNNLFVSTTSDALSFQAHNDQPRTINVFNNTIVAAGTGINISGIDTNFTQRVIGNAIFAGTPFNVAAEVETAGNITDLTANATNYLTNPFALPGSGLDLFPLPGQLTGSPLNTVPFQTFTEWTQDFNYNPHDGTHRGAYAGSGTNPGWLPQLSRKPMGTPPILDQHIYLPQVSNP
jgi:hypothetical protein